MTVSMDGEPPLDLSSPTIKSLLAYLVLNRDRAVDRRRLAFLLWPRGTEFAARRNLRQYIHRLRRILEPVDPQGQLVETQGNLVRFCPPDPWFLDIDAFEVAAAHDESLEEAVALYRGELLSDIYEDWLEPERQRLARLFGQTLLRLIDRLESAGDVARAILYAEHYLAQEPLLESAYVRLMRLNYALGDRARIKDIYQKLVETLDEELGVRPLPETTLMYQAMVAGEYKENLTLPPLPSKARDTTSNHEKTEARHPSLIGREEDRAWLDEVLSQAEAGHGGVCLIHGESGIGKTRFVTEWLSSVQTPTYVFSGRSYEFESMLPYSPLADALRRGLKDQAIPWEMFRPPPTWLAALHSLVPDLQARFLVSDAAGPGRDYHIFEGLGNFLLTLSRQRLLVLFLDNLHCADAPTWNFVGYLAQAAIQARLLVVIAARLEDVPQEAARLIHSLRQRGWLRERKLQRLSKEDTRQLISELRPQDPPDPGFAAQIYQETEGNPFFIIETLSALREAGADWTGKLPTDDPDNRSALAIPLQIQEVILSRLDKLGEESRAALGVAAAIGREFSFELLREASQLPAEVLLNALDDWLTRDLVQETSDGYDFTHEKLSHVIYQQLSRARRQWIHLQIAGYLETHTPDLDAAQLANHYYLSSEPARALPYLIQAGERALSVRSYREAHEFGLRAIGLFGRFPSLRQSQQTERLDLTLQLAQAHSYIGALPRALEMLQEAERMAEALGDISRLAGIFIRSARLFWLRGHPQTASDYARRALRHAEELDDATLRWAALRMLGRASVVLSQYDDAIAYLLRYTHLAEQGPSPADLPVIYGYLGVAYARVGSWQRAIHAAQTGLDLADAGLPGATHVVARMQLAFIYAELREWQEALAVAEPVRWLWQQDGMSPHSFMLRAVVGLSLVHTGQIESGLAEIEAAIKWADDVDYRMLPHLPWLFLGPCYQAAGDPERGLGAAHRAANSAAQMGDRWAEAVALRTQAEIEAQAPRPDWTAIEKKLLAARTILQAIRARPDLARTFLSLHHLYVQVGQIGWASDCLSQATTIFDELDMGDELLAAQSHAADEHKSAVTIPPLTLSGPDVPGATVILYVDDDALSLEIFKLWVANVMGISEVIVLDDNTNFMEQVHNLPAIPQVIFLDIQMQPYDGYQMLTMLRSEAAYRDSMIIALTANVMAADVNKLKAAGFNGMIGKPIMPEAFGELVQKIMAGDSVWFIH